MIGTQYLLLIGWAGGILSSFVASLAYQRFVDWKKRKSKANYITYTWVEDTVRFEGQVSSGTVDMGEVARSVLGIQETEDN